VLTTYWSQLGNVSEYKVLLTLDRRHVCLTTKHGDRPVGAITEVKVPQARLCSSPISISIRRIFTKKIENKLAWAKEAKQFAARIISSVVALDKALHSSGEVTRNRNGRRIPHSNSLSKTDCGPSFWMLNVKLKRRKSEKKTSRHC